MSKEKFIHAVTITRAGQITVPKQARRELNLEEGQKLLVYIRNGEIVLRKPQLKKK